MLEYPVSLYTSVYWTKRVFVVFALFLFLCSGFRMFQFVSKRVTRILPGDVIVRPELGFQKIDNLTISAYIQPPASFAPKEFLNDTVRGDFDTEQKYPLTNTKQPVANVYKIAPQEIDLTTLEKPRLVAKTMGFQQEPEITSTTQTWREGFKELTINGQYNLVKYTDNLLKQLTLEEFTSSTMNTDPAMRTFFNAALTKYGIASDFTSYKFRMEYVNYDKETDSYIPSGKEEFGQYVRINADRLYPNLSKADKKATTTAIYPSATYSNNNIIFTRNPQGNREGEYIVELNLHNWSLNQEISDKNKDVQTYSIRTPREAFEELKKTNKYIVSITDWDTGLPIKPEQLAGIEQVKVREINLKMYENTIDTTYIQPVYSFVSQVEKDGKEIRIIYLIPAVIQSA